MPAKLINVKIDTVRYSTVTKTTTCCDKHVPPSYDSGPSMRATSPSFCRNGFCRNCAMWSGLAVKKQFTALANAPFDISIFRYGAFLRKLIMPMNTHLVQYILAGLNDKSIAEHPNIGA